MLIASGKYLKSWWHVLSCQRWCWLSKSASNQPSTLPSISIVSMSSEQEGGGSEILQTSRTYEPFLEWDRGVSEYLAKAFGEERLAAITRALW